MATKLRIGIDRIDAVRVGRTAWAHHDDGTGRWHVVDSDDVRAAGAMPDWDYSTWCADTFSRSPTKSERRFAEAHGTTMAEGGAR